VERNRKWLLVAARLLVAIVFLLNGFGIIALKRLSWCTFGAL
jgi:hypothetical protein